jgi:long-chain acyl-CoA synthetase
MYPGIHARTHPDRAAVIMTGSGHSVTYAQLEDRSLRLANWFRQAGLRQGDVVALMSENDARIFEVYWATQRLGLYLTSINHRLRTDEVKYVVQNSAARALIVGRGGAEVAATIGEIPALEHRIAFAANVPGYRQLDELIAMTPAARPQHEPRGADMLYSSGTTGRPKGVRPPLPKRDVSEPGDTMVAMFSQYFGLSSDTVYLSPGPLYHAAPLRTCTTVQALGGTVLVMERFDAEAALAAISHHRATHSQWVPTMFVRMLKLSIAVRSLYDVSSMQVAIHAAAPCPVEVKRQMMDWWGPILHEYYSSTEMNGLTVIGPQEWLTKPGSVGRAVLGIIHICDDLGRTVPTGQDGLIYFERDAMPFEYWGDPEKTASTRHPQHPTWTAVGDIGHVDDDGYLFLTDRKDFTIIAGGVNIYPQEIENELALHPAIADVAVIGVPDPEMGEQVKALVQLTPGREGSDKLAAELIALVRERLAPYKLPKSVDFVEALPRTLTGKLMKGELRKRYWPTNRI